MFKCEDCPDILYSSINLIIDVVKEKKLQNSVLTAEQNHSDLMPAIYEGIHLVEAFIPIKRYPHFRWLKNMGMHI